MKKVTIYTTPTCGFCKMAKEFLTKHSVEYSEFDVAADSAKAEEMVEKSGQMGVPVILVGEGDDEAMIVGFDQAKLAELLGIEA